MKTWLRTLTVAASMVICGSAGAQDRSILHKVLDSGTLKVGTTGDFNPMSFKDPETKEYRGHQIDAAKQLATDMGVEVEFVATDWKTLINGVVAGKYDVAMTGTSMTVTRAKAAGYTIPWGRTGYLPLTRKELADRFGTWEDLNSPDVTVGYNLGTSFADFVKLRLPKARVKECRVAGPGLAGPAGRKGGRHHLQHPGGGQALQHPRGADDPLPEGGQQPAAVVHRAPGRPSVAQLHEQLDAHEARGRLLQGAQREMGHPGPGLTPGLTLASSSAAVVGRHGGGRHDGDLPPPGAVIRCTS